MLTVFVFFHIIDVITIDKTGEYFRLVYDVKGRFAIHRITAEEAKVQLNAYSFYSSMAKPCVVFTVQALQSSPCPGWT